MKTFIPRFGKCEKCGYKGSVDVNQKDEQVCNICFLSECVNVNEKI